MIVDAFLYSGEKEMLKIRCEEMRDLDVVHVLIESQYTFTGIPKPVCYHEINKIFSGYPIVPFVTPFVHDKDPWAAERAQRDFIKTAVKFCKDDDIIMITDVDEIPRAEVVKEFCGDYAALIMDKFGYYLNCREGVQSWDRGRICRYGYLKDKTPDSVRNAGFDQKLPNAGYHFSYCGGIDAIMTKFKSFSHQEPDVQKHANREEIIRKMAVGESLWGQDSWTILPTPLTEPEFPKYIVDNQDTIFRNMILKP